MAHCLANAQTSLDPGSRTTLVQYARKRYFKNHKMMSAVDKLHKAVPGGQSSAPSSPGSLWDTVVRSVETVVGGAQVAQSVGSDLKSAAGRVLQQLVTASVPGANRIT
ncbi:hypothetical protein BGW80DRAFT_1459005 [Lactifluus volemus]|nr:hypothetical protein BGW80DRAFT_1459005 [Lactifluus volemus]